MYDAPSESFERRRAQVRIRWDVRIPLRDGTCLSALLYLPGPEGRRCAIFTLTPYISQSCHDMGMYFAGHGYAYLVADVRGRGDSEGQFHPLNEARDAYDAIEWLARQSYCTGKVAMWGLSYMGYTQWAAAKELPPHLATIVPVASPYRGVDSPLRNNFFSPNSIRWLMGIAGRVSQDRLFADQAYWKDKLREWFRSGRPLNELDDFVGRPSPLFKEWMEHPTQDAYWDSHNPTAEQYAGISLPILTITGAYDGDQLGALAHYREHLKHASPAARDRHYLIIGPWNHTGTKTPTLEFCGVKAGLRSLLDISKLHAEWYTWAMADGPKPEFLQKKVAYYVMGADQWRYADSLNAITESLRPLYLGSLGNPTDVFRSGLLLDQAPLQSDVGEYVYDPCDVTSADVESSIDAESRVDQRMTYSLSGKQLIYHSLPFSNDTEISGFFRFCAWLSIDQPDTSFHVAVYEVAIDGTVVQLTADWMRARYRESLREEKLITTTDPLSYEFRQFMFVSRVVRKGSRIRLVFGPLNSIHWQRTYNSAAPVSSESIRDARPVKVSLHHDAKHPSALYVPLGKQDPPVNRDC